MILQQITALGRDSSYLSHIISSATSSLINLWQTIAFSFLRFLCYHWLSFCSHRSYLHRTFTLFLLIVCLCFCFFSSCVYLCSLLPCTFSEWVPSLIFIYEGFFFFCCKCIENWINYVMNYGNIWFHEKG